MKADVPATSDVVELAERPPILKHLFSYRYRGNGVELACARLRNNGSVEIDVMVTKRLPPESVESLIRALEMAVKRARSWQKERK